MDLLVQIVNLRFSFGVSESISPGFSNLSVEFVETECSSKFYRSC